MKIYKVHREDWDWECASGFVIRAESAEQAREIAAANCGGEGASVWFDPQHSKCEALQPQGEAGIIMRDFCAG